MQLCSLPVCPELTRSRIPQTRDQGRLLAVSGTGQSHSWPLSHTHTRTHTCTHTRTHTHTHTHTHMHTHTHTYTHTHTHTRTHTRTHTCTHTHTHTHTHTYTHTHTHTHTHTCTHTHTSLLGTITRATTVKVLECSRQFQCSRCHHVFTVTSDLEQYNAIPKPQRCVGKISIAQRNDVIMM